MFVSLLAMQKPVRKSNGNMVIFTLGFIRVAESAYQAFVAEILVTQSRLSTLEEKDFSQGVQ